MSGLYVGQPRGGRPRAGSHGHFETRHERGSLRDIERRAAIERSRQRHRAADTFSLSDTTKDYGDRQVGTVEDFTVKHVTEGQSFNSAMHKLWEVGWAPDTNDWTEYMILGDGTYGIVYKGRQRWGSKKPVAIKMMDLTRQKVDTENGIQFVPFPPEKIKKMKIAVGNEIKTLSRLQRLNNPNIVRQFDHFIVDTSMFVILEYCNSQTLHEYLYEYFPERYAIPEPQLRYWFRQMVNGLRGIHSKNIVHRDLKPDNILVHRHSKPNVWSVLKICDFGFAIDATPPNTTLTHIGGTPAYCAPEIYKALLANHFVPEPPQVLETYPAMPIDVWALGCILYEMINRNRVVNAKLANRFQCQSTMQRLEHFAQSPHVPASCTPELKDILHQMLRADPVNRPPIDMVSHAPWMVATTVQEPTLVYFSRRFPQE